MTQKVLIDKKNLYANRYRNATKNTKFRSLYIGIKHRLQNIYKRGFNRFAVEYVSVVKILKNQYLNVLMALYDDDFSGNSNNHVQLP